MWEKLVFLPRIVVGVKVTEVVGLSLMRNLVTSVTPRDGVAVASEFITKTLLPKYSDLVYWNGERIWTDAEGTTTVLYSVLLPFTKGMDVSDGR
jgi:3-deoxy-D-arabino-heptulosonate 7-phosphate (DAHP) synthase